MDEVFAKPLDIQQLERYYSRLKGARRERPDAALSAPVEGRRRALPEGSVRSQEEQL